VLLAASLRPYLGANMRRLTSPWSRLTPFTEPLPRTAR
jgi:hypothetical protein